MKRLFVKIFAGYLAVIIILSALILVFSFQTIKENYLETRAHELYLLNNILKSQVTNLLETGQYSSVDSIVKSIGRNLEVRITIIDTNGVVLGDSRNDPSKMENHLSRPEIQAAKAKSFGEISRYSSTVHEEMIYVAIPIKYNDRLLGYSRLSLYLKDINILVGNVKQNILNITLLVGILTLFAVLIFSRQITKPIKALTEAARRVARGNFDTKVNLHSRDEIKELADNFNNMTERIKSLFSQVSMQKEELDVIIGSLQEGLVVIDNKGKIILSNHGFNGIVNNDNPRDRFFWEVVRNSDFISLVKKAQKTRDNLSDEFEMNGITYLLSANYIQAKDEIVLILYNTSQIKKLEQIKKDIVQNVSHELRTPLTAIKGFIETLEDEVDESKRYYVEIIKRHTDRLINIVQDLLLLSKLEENQASLILSDVDLKSLVDNVIVLFSQKMKEKNLYLNIHIDEGLSPVKADSFKLEQMLINIIDNACKYTDEGGITINISKDNGLVRFEIKDTGIGIAREHLERIFERFYTVDKSRSRKLGGTGLGLSIVKHIVLLHRGSIKIESEPGKGTRFIISIPANVTDKILG